MYFQEVCYILASCTLSTNMGKTSWAFWKKLYIKDSNVFSRSLLFFSFMYSLDEHGQDFLDILEEAIHQGF